MDFDDNDNPWTVPGEGQEGNSWPSLKNELENATKHLEDPYVRHDWKGDDRIESLEKMSPDAAPDDFVEDEDEFGEFVAPNGTIPFDQDNLGDSEIVLLKPVPILKPAAAQSKK